MVHASRVLLFWNESVVPKGGICMDLCAIGSRIKAAREKAGMTQEDLAAALEMSPTHISVIERGVKAPKLERNP